MSAGEFPIYDAHNHLQDERLRREGEGIREELERIGLRRCVVNGTREEDWEDVAELARKDSRVIPSFGLHPWHIGGRSKEWFARLEYQLREFPSGVGEIGLDKWMRDSDFAGQEVVFRQQWQLAARLNVPVTVHCLKAWGPLLEIIRKEPGPACGFLLHSYGGSRELIQPLAKLGACFSISGYFAHERKARQREVFKAVPRDRILIETDAPDMLGPSGLVRYSLRDPKLNHPANIAGVYEFAAELLSMPLAELAGQAGQNFVRLFGGIVR